YCEVNGKIYPIPNWMLSPECSQFSLGPPLISIKALLELRDLFASLPLPADCDSASLHAIPKEAIDEATLSADEPAARQCAARRKSGGPVRGPHCRSDGTPHQRSGRKTRAP